MSLLENDSTLGRNRLDGLSRYFAGRQSIGTIPHARSRRQGETAMAESKKLCPKTSSATKAASPKLYTLVVFHAAEDRRMRCTS
jgi:hypothetical protein